MKALMLNDFIPDDGCPLGIPSVMGTPGQIYKLGSEGSAATAKAIVYGTSSSLQFTQPQKYLYIVPKIWCFTLSRVRLLREELMIS